MDNLESARKIVPFCCKHSKIRVSSILGYVNMVCEEVMDLVVSLNCDFVITPCDECKEAKEVKNKK